MQGENSNNFGRRLRWLRVAQGFAGEVGANRLAVVLGVGVSTVYSWEKLEHAPKGEVVARLAKALDIPELKLLGMEEPVRVDRVEEESDPPYGEEQQRRAKLRRECEKHVGLYLDAAEKFPEGMVVARYNIQRRLPLSDFELTEAAALELYRKSRDPQGMIAAGAPTEVTPVIKRKRRA